MSLLYAIMRMLRGLAAAGVLTAVLVRGQVADDPVTVPVSFQGMFATNGTGDPDNQANVSIHPLGVTGAAGWAYGESEGATGVLTSGGFARLRPGRTYLFEIDSYEITRVQAKITPPSGYRAFINGVEHEMFDWQMGNGGVLDPQGFFSVRLEDGGSAGVGEVDSLRPGRLLWSIGLGSLRNGKPAGSIRLSEEGITANAFKPQALYYDHDARNENGRYHGDDIGEVMVVKVNNVLRQVYATTVLADIVQNNDHSYYIRLYPRDQISDPAPDSSTLPFTVSGTPLFEYLVENPNYPALDTMRITRTVNQNGTLVTWTQMTKSSPAAGTNVWLVHDWVEKQAGATTVSSPIQHRWTYTDNERNELLEVLDSSGVIAHSTFKRYDDLSFGVETTRELSYEIAGYNGIAPVRTDYTYHNDFGSLGSWHKVRTVVSNEGSWTAFDYHNEFLACGQILQIRRPHKDAPTSDLGYNQNYGEVTTFSYDFVDGFGTQRLPTRIESAIDGRTVSRTEFSYAYEFITDASVPYSPVTNAIMPLLVTTRKDHFNSFSQYLTTITKTYAEDADPENRFFPGLPYSVERPDNTMSVNVYFHAYFTPAIPFQPLATGGARVHVTLNGTRDTAMGVPMPSYNTLSQPLPTNFRIVSGKSSESRVLLGITGLPGIAEKRVYVGTWEVTGQDWPSYISFIWLSTTQRRTGADGSLWNAADNTWAQGRLTASVDEHGIRQSFSYDNVGRVQSTTKDGASANGTTLAAVTVTSTYDAAGRVRTRSTSGAGETLTSTTTYDTAGRITNESVPGHGTTSQVYDVLNRVTTTTLPTSSTRIENRYRDGRPLSVTGTGVVSEYYDYSVEADGRRRSQVSLRSATDVRKQESWVDWLGRTVELRRPGFNNGAAYSETRSYEATKGHLTTVSRTGYAPTRYEYNGMGEMVRSGLDLNGGVLDPASTDRITDSDTTVESFEGAYWVVSRSWAFHQHNVNAKKLMSTTRQRMTALGPTLRDELRTWDAEDNETRRTLTVDTASKLVTVTTTRPGLATSATETTLNGLAIATTGHDGLTSTQAYDALGRLKSVTDPRTGTAASNTFTYIANTTLVYQKRDASNRIVATATYDGAGRPVFVQNADGRTARTSYNALGLVEYQWGSAAYPVSFTYDSYGQRTHQRTYRDSSNVVPNSWETSAWPGGSAPADTTEWEYDAYTGLVKRKYDPSRQYVEYTYNERGQTYQRFWARTYNGQRVTTTYSYFPGTGELQSISYNDTTPNVNYQAASGESYTRLGQPTTVNDFTGSRSFAYDPSYPWRQTSETLSGSFYGSRMLATIYEANTVANTADTSYVGHTAAMVKGRYAGYRFGTNPTPTSYDLELDYAVSNAARVAGLIAKRAGGSVSRQFVYGYEPTPLGQASNLIKTLSVVGSAFQVSRSFEASRDLMTRIEASWGSTSRTRFDYTYTDIGQRRTSVQSGDAFADLGPTHQRYAYNTRGELASAYAYNGIDPESTAAPLSARLHDYDYDAIGNRKWSNSSGASGVRDNYAVNQNNQYTQRENNTLAVNGVANVSAKVAVATPLASAAMGAGLAGRPSGGTHWGHNLVVDNQSGPFSGNINAYAVIPGGGTGGADLFRLESKSAWLPRGLQSFSYDLDGNLTSDGLWDYAWDAENRLIRATTTSIASAAGRPNIVVEFRYDYQHRRVKKEVRNAVTQQATSERRFVYDGWNLIAETDGAGLLKRSYAWGLDVTGNTTTAGGVGALLQIHDAEQNKTLFPSYDANGNIVALFNADTAGLEASYEYSPFGELLRAQGAYALTNPFRFSAKWQDDETGLLYYGFRYYSSRDGRFLGRDPIGESGGLNLYGFCGNDGVNAWDYLGQSWLSNLLKKGRQLSHKIARALMPFRGLRSLDHRFERWEDNHQREIVMVLSSIASFWTGGVAINMANYWEWSAGACAAFGGAAAGFTGSALNTALTGGSFSQTLRAGLFGGAIGGLVAYGAYKTSEMIYNWKTPASAREATFYHVTRVQSGDYAYERLDISTIENDSLRGKLWINGQSNDFYKAMDLGKIYIGSEDFYLAHNPSVSGFMDTMESALDKLSGQSPMSKSISNIMAKFDLPETAIYAHSQGTILARNALAMRAAAGQTMAGVRVAFDGAAVNELSSRMVFRAMGVDLVRFRTHSFDAVPNIVGYNALTYPNPFRLVGSLLASPLLAIGGQWSPHTYPDGGSHLNWVPDWY